MTAYKKSIGSPISSFFWETESFNLILKSVSLFVAITSSISTNSFWIFSGTCESTSRINFTALSSRINFTALSLRIFEKEYGLIGLNFILSLFMVDSIAPMNAITVL